MKIRKKIIVGVLLGLVLMALSFLFYAFGGHLIVKEYIARENKTNLSFSFNRCSESSGGSDQITSYEWVTDDRLVVKGVVYPNCAATWLFGNYRINKKSLSLLYSPVSMSFMACVCAHKVEYEISGLVKQEYEIQILEEGEIYEEPKFLYWLMGVYDE
ncbi:MAG: hypothetical protein ABW101_08855 [Candidatus Thiodiazotropha sp.]